TRPNCRLDRFSFVLRSPAPPATHALSLHDALPIFGRTHVLHLEHRALARLILPVRRLRDHAVEPRALELREPSRCHAAVARHGRSEEHTSELQSRGHLVCRLLLEKKKSTPHPPKL